MRRTPPNPACFAGEWDPDAARCISCRVQPACVEATVAAALDRGHRSAGELEAAGMPARAADVVAHALGRLAGSVPSTPAPAPIPTFARWAKERETRPPIAQIQPGQELRREYQGTLYVVRCELGCWVMAGVRYPTLASVVVAIAGARQYPRPVRATGSRPNGTRTGAICSAVRFFALRPRNIGRRLR